MDFSWFNTESLEKAGAIIVALSAISLCVIIFKGYREQGKEFNKITTNHLHDAHEDKLKDIESREKNTQVLQKLVDRTEK